MIQNNLTKAASVPLQVQPAGEQALYYAEDPLAEDDEELQIEASHLSPPRKNVGHSKFFHNFRNGLLQNQTKPQSDQTVNQAAACLANLSAGQTPAN